MNIVIGNCALSPTSEDQLPRQGNLRKSFGFIACRAARATRSPSQSGLNVHVEEDRANDVYRCPPNG